MARTFTVRTWEPEWVPYTWVVDVDDDSLSDEEAMEAARSLDENTGLVLVTRTPGVNSLDMEHLDRDVESVEVGNLLAEQLEEAGLELDFGR